ncbi:MAG: hypothetical protein K0Q95_3309 [Bacteroidota bacterium]|jgi:uncharacterized protein YcaQ|nr:hypothetical protein [Bacteroidota bacterium]
MQQALPTLPLETVRLLALKCQGLSGKPFGKAKKGALAAVQHLGYVQIDTLSVVARAHHHILYSRLPDYKETYLSELLEKDKQVFEYWSHAASYLPMSDYRFSLPRKKLFTEGKSHWFEKDTKIMKYVLDRIKAEGPLQSKDFEFKRTDPGNWYEWKPAKKALEQLFMEGKLMVAKRQGFQKVYDLTERVLPDEVNTKMPTEKEYIEHLIKRAVEANGVVEEKEISYLRKGMKEPVKKVLTGLLKSEKYIEVMVEGSGNSKFITSAVHLKLLDKLNVKPEVHLLSPFDNIVIQRKRLERIFNFDYQIECYVPEPKRKYGYFCLPVLFGDKFIGRFDPKADRAGKTFYIKSMYFEKGFKPDEQFNLLFAEKLKAFAAFNGCDKIKIDKADKKWKTEMKKYF